MAKGLSYVQRSLRYLEQGGCITGIVERFNPYVGGHGVRQDLFGIFDLISIMPKGICGVQVSGSDFAEHVRKILASEVALEWLKSGGLIQLIGWRKLLKTRGGKLKVWTPRIRNFIKEDFV